MFDTLRYDIQSVFDRDPAARNVIEILCCYPGLQAIWGYRLSNWLWSRGFKLLGRLVSQLFRFITGIEIHPGSVIGGGLFIDHGMGVVIGETAEIGNGVTLYHGVTLGGTSLNKGKRHPTLGDKVVVGAGAKILGAIEIGRNSRIGANAVVVKPVPENSVVVGVPGQVVVRSKPRLEERQPDLDHGQLPDTIGETLAAVVAHVERLEERINGHSPIIPEMPMPEHGVWQGDDFSI